MEKAAPDLLTRLLKDVSRSFYLTMRVLPAGVRHQIGLAYLLARTSDTLADTELIPESERLNALSDFGARVAGTRQQALDFPTFVNQQSNPAEATLLRRAEESIAVLQQLSPEDQALVRRVIAVIISGQDLDLRRFTGGSESSVIALATDAELDDYTYRVAGIVGEFWSKLCRVHLFPRDPLDETNLIEKGVKFGKGLQLVNILRDVPKDLRAGRCYIPEATLSQAGLRPSDLLVPSSIGKFRQVYNPLLSRANKFMHDAWAYSNMLPRNQVRLRLACAWPILIARSTLKSLRAGNVLDPSKRIKITRAQVRGIMIRSLLAYPRTKAWDRLFQNSG